MCCCFGGIAIVAFSNDEESTEAVEGAETISSYQVGIFWAIVAVLTFALGYVSTRRLKSIHYSVIQFHYSSISTIVNIIWLIVTITGANGRQVFTFGWDTQIWLKLLGLCTTNFIGQNLITCMNQSINPATVGLFLYIQIVYNLTVDYAVFDVVLNGMQILGASICVIFSIAAAYYKHLKTK